MAIVLAGLALWQRGLAQDEARRGGVYGLAGASEAVLDEDPELAILLALKAAEVSEDAGDPVTPATLTALQGAVQNSRLESVIEGGLFGVAVSSDGAFLATPAVGEDAVVVWDPVTGDELRTLTGPQFVFGVEFSPIGTLLAVGHGPDADGDDGSIAVWDAATGEEVVRLPVNDEWPVPHWSSDGTLLIAVGHEGSEERPVTVWRSPSMTEVNSFQIPGNSTSERFLDESTLVVARRGDDRVTFYDVTTGREVEDLDIDDIPFDDASEAAIGVDPVGGRLVLVGSDTQVWDLESKSLLWRSSRTELPEVDPARGWLATYGTGGVITVLDLEDGSEIMTLAGHPAAVNDVAFDPTRDRLYSAPFAGGTRVWDITPAGPAGSDVIPIDSGQNISSSPGPVKMVVSPTGSEIAVTTGGGKITRYASDSGAILGSVDGAMNWFLPAPVSPDWRLLAVIPPDLVPGTGEPLLEASIEHMTTGEPVDQLPPCVWPKGFSSDGAMLALDGGEVSGMMSQCSPENVGADIDLRSRVIDVLTGEVLLDLGERPLVGANALFNPPGVFEADRYLAVNVGFEVVEIHDIVTGEVVAEISFEERDPAVHIIRPHWAIPRHWRAERPRLGGGCRGVGGGRNGRGGHGHERGGGQRRGGTNRPWTGRGSRHGGPRPEHTALGHPHRPGAPRIGQDARRPSSGGVRTGWRTALHRRQHGTRPRGADLPPRRRSDDRPGREQGDQEPHRGRVRALPPRRQTGQLPVGFFSRCPRRGEYPTP